MATRSRTLALVLRAAPLSSAVAVACGGDAGSPSPAQDASAPPVDASADSSVPKPDAADSGGNTAQDAGRDSSMPPIDAGTDAGSVDSGSDSGIDTGIDAGVDAAPPPSVCALASLPEIPFSAGPYGTHRHDVAAD